MRRLLLAVCAIVGMMSAAASQPALPSVTCPSPCTFPNNHVTYAPTNGTPVAPNDYIPIQRLVTTPSGLLIQVDNPSTAGTYLNVQDFANGIYNSAVAAGSGAGAAAASQAFMSLSQQLVQVSSQISSLQRGYQRLSEGVALAGSFNIVPPNPGDRFSVSIGGAGFNGYGAGSIAFAARINEQATVFVGYARSQSENLIKGGASLSIH